MKLLIKNGRVVDPANNLDEPRDILVENGKINRIAKVINNGADKTIDAAGKIVLPGLVDMHVHLRQPGREDKETIASGTKAALKGGVTTLLAMANTSPAIDSVENIRMLKDIIAETAVNNVLICAAITEARSGKELTQIAKLRKESIVAISDDGASVDSTELMYKAMRKARENKIPVICHCEDKLLSGGGVMNLGSISTRLGLKGISPESEYKRVQRDISLAEKAKCRVHICHVSCAETVEIIAKAKKKGVKVTCETAPHYFSLCEEALLEYDTNKKMNPPLRSRKDLEAIKEGLAKGVIDAIASDHAPHTISDKDIEFDRAEFGVIGLETELAAAITYLVLPRVLSWAELAKKMSWNPARILGIDKGTLTPGRDADLIIVDPEKSWLVKKEDFVSKSKNSAFIGVDLKGVVETTILDGKIAYKQEIKD
ncbi:MAG: dihydroorotase [Candidatus Omnitrophica bacterium]|nr:dihydroorotase [Candidatus Omnitrophota bacterium]